MNLSSVMASILCRATRLSSLQSQEVRATGQESMAALKLLPGLKRSHRMASSQSGGSCRLPNVVVGCQEPREPHLVRLRTIWYVKPSTLGAIFHLQVHSTPWS